MRHKSNKPDYLSVWATIDLDKVTQRINRVTWRIDQVIQKYELDNSNKTNH